MSVREPWPVRPGWPQHGGAWHPQHPQHAQHAQHPQPGWHPAPPLPRSQPWYDQARNWYVFTPILSFGLGATALPLWAATRAGQQKTDRRLQSSAARAHLYGHAALFGLVLVVSFVLSGLAPQDASGATTGPLAAMSSLLLLLNLVVAVGYAVRMRSRVFPKDPPVAVGDLETLPGVQQARARRQLRERYRQLAASDPLIAAEIGVGRPDRPRPFDDGGLLDVNALDAAQLVRHGGLSPAEAEQLVAARQRFGRLSNADELRVHTSLSEPAVERLSEYGLFAH